MKRISTLFVVLALSIALIGCSGSEASTTASETPSEKTKPDGTMTVADKGQCSQCKQEFAMTALKDHDGAKICETCLATHNH